MAALFPKGYFAGNHEEVFHGIMPQAPATTSRILLACMPKSGSTFLSRIICELPGMRRAELFAGYERREQEIEESRVIEVEKKTQIMRDLWRRDLLVDKTKPSGWVAQHHTRFSRRTLEILTKYKIKPVILVRNIFDVVPSLYDHLTGASTFMSMAYVPEEVQYDENLFYEFIAEMIIPWYFNFYVGWSTYGAAPIVTYEDLVRDPHLFLGRLFESLEIKLEPGEIDGAISRAGEGFTRKNKAVVGRGSQLPSSIRTKIETYAKFYPHIDFSPIGLPANADPTAVSVPSSLQRGEV